MPGAAVTLTATSLVVYVWHYLVARLLYDDLIRPLAQHGVGGAALVGACALGLGLLVARARRARRR
jgi:uncharacterized membrane protein YjfL (UPF0719 family)